MLEVRECKLEDCNAAGNFLQSGFWGAFKAHFAWKPHAFIVNLQGADAFSLLVLTRNLVAGFGFAYVPWGPLLKGQITENDADFNAHLSELCRSLKPLLPSNIAFVRLDPPQYTKDGDAKRQIYKPFIHAGADIQAPDTVLLDLMPSLDDILAGMKPKCRYNVRLGGKKVDVYKSDKAELPVFYKIFKETGLRDGIAIHGIDYYKTLFDIGCETFDVRLYLAKYEGTVIAGIITLFYGETATYLYGASSNMHRNMMAPYALQWRAMQDAKLSGCLVYDLFGIPPTDDPKHPMAGLYRFKTGFGGTIVHRTGCQDYVYKTVFTKVFGAAERLRKMLRDRRKNRHG
ncbi:MAG: lipid II:glycine glycyltransferase FemX [Termitinemataceae bacterium]|nr:MAG: lipid II:glycine glycyltransferase FemX [Termitinemataceae bacterium]